MSKQRYNELFTCINSDKKEDISMLKQIAPLSLQHPRSTKNRQTSEEETLKIEKVAKEWK